MFCIYLSMLTTSHMYKPASVLPSWGRLYNTLHTILPLLRRDRNRKIQQLRPCNVFGRLAIQFGRGPALSTERYEIRHGWAYQP
jgi:hypothetical protein